MAEHLVNDRLINGGAIEFQKILPNRQHTLMRPVFLGEALFLLGPTVVNIHNVHCPISNVCQHIYPAKVPQMVRDGSKALGKNVRSNKISAIVHASECDIRMILLQ